jgi:hypothetical protein
MKRFMVIWAIGLLLVLAGCRVAVIVVPSTDWQFSLLYDPMRMAAAAGTPEGMFEDLTFTFDEPTGTATPLVLEFR